MILSSNHYSYQVSYKSNVANACKSLPLIELRDAKLYEICYLWIIWIFYGQIFLSSHDSSTIWLQSPNLRNTIPWVGFDRGSDQILINFKLESVRPLLPEFNILQLYKFSVVDTQIFYGHFVLWKFDCSLSKFWITCLDVSYDIYMNTCMFWGVSLVYCIYHIIH